MPDGVRRIARRSARFELTRVALASGILSAQGGCTLERSGVDEPTGTAQSPLVTLVQCASFTKDLPTIEDVAPGNATACSAGSSATSILGAADETLSGAGAYEAFGPGAVGTTTFGVRLPSGSVVTQLDVPTRIFVCNGDDGKVASTIAAQRLDGTWQTLATTANQANFAFWSPTFTLAPPSAFVPAAASSFSVRVRMSAGAIGRNDIDLDRIALSVTTASGGSSDAGATDSSLADSATSDSGPRDSGAADSSAADSATSEAGGADACVPITSCAASQCGRTVSDGCGGSLACQACPGDGVQCSSAVVNPSSHRFTEVAVTAGGTWVATFTAGARTVRLKGPSMRTFKEAKTPTGTPSATITHDTWVRLWPDAKGWSGGCSGGVLDASSDAWLANARGGDTDDVLSIAMQYANGGPMDADYSPDETIPGADMTDYRQQTLYSAFDKAYEEPEYPEWGPGYVDCSGFVREVFAYRLGYAWHVRAKRPRDTYSYAQDGAIWKLSEDQFFNGPGVVVSDYPKDSRGRPAWGTRNVQYGVLRVGDLLFFHSTSADDVTHEGIYLGATDGTGKRRVLSSRFYLKGPSIDRSTDTGSTAGDSIIDGSATSDALTRTYRAARRL